jgi:hypothetical protein
MRPQDFDSVLTLFRGVRSIGDLQAQLRLDLEAMQFTASAQDGEALIDARCDHLQGDLVESSEIAFDDDLFVAVERYSGAEFLPISGPMVLRVLDGADLEALLTDARATDRDGVISELSAHPYVHVADQCALGRGTCAGLDGRTVVTQSGDALTTVIGRAGHPGSDGACAHHCTTAEVEEALGALSVEDRRLLARYLETLDVTRALAQRHQVPCAPAVMLGSALSGQEVGAVHVVRLGDQLAVFDPATRAVAVVGDTAARLVRAATISEDALTATADELGMPRAQLTAAVTAVARGLEQSGIQIGLLAAA